MRVKGKLIARLHFYLSRVQFFDLSFNCLGSVGGSGDHDPGTTTVDRPDSREMCRMWKRCFASGAKVPSSSSSSA
eukprot:1731049-Amphidinium_carterae.1